MNAKAREDESRTRKASEGDRNSNGVTHDQLEAIAPADRIAVMRSGLIEQIGTPGEIYHNARTIFVANFIGSPSMNLIDCELVHNRAEQF